MLRKKILITEEQGFAEAIVKSIQEDVRVTERIDEKGIVPAFFVNYRLVPEGDREVVIELYIVSHPTSRIVLDEFIKWLVTNYGAVYVDGFQEVK